MFYNRYLSIHTKNGRITNKDLKLELAASNIGPAYSHVDVNDDVISLHFASELTIAEENMLDAVLAAHEGNPLVETVAPAKVEITRREPFADKHLADGSSLFRRKHGVRIDVPGNSVVPIQLTVPYAKCKIDEVEIVNCTAVDTCDFLVRDNSAGTFSSTPNSVLNHFGFDVNLSDIYYTDVSNYDATLYKTMIVEVTYANNEATTKSIGVNFVLHEVVTP